MPIFTVTAMTSTSLVCEIEAESYESALRIADYELITDDFTPMFTDFTLGHVLENN